MERRYSPTERHPFLAACNLMTLFVGIIIAFQATLAGFITDTAEINVVFLVGVLLIFLGINTGKVTMNFRHWDYGLDVGQKIFASISIFIGAMVTGWVIINILHP